MAALFGNFNNYEVKYVIMNDICKHHHVIKNVNAVIFGFFRSKTINLK